MDATSLIRTHPHSVAALTLRARTLAHTQKGGGVRAAQVDLRKAKAMAVRQRNAAAEVNVLLAEAEVYQLAAQPRLAMESLKRAARLAPDVWCCAGMEVTGEGANLSVAMCVCVCVCTLFRTGARVLDWAGCCMETMMQMKMWLSTWTPSLTFAMQ